jgi:hypothetical protein
VHNKEDAIDIFNMLLSSCKEHYWNGITTIMYSTGRVSKSHLNSLVSAVDMMHDKHDTMGRRRLIVECSSVDRTYPPAVSPLRISQTDMYLCNIEEDTPATIIDIFPV